ncbi:meiosis inhibitor protein 1-like isoform X2 [Acipenser ruthenus]|uniref:meiosis inhibitor protein 1-like isoform X2 n=1 Tax=Acipenser ruthenus TaxID=7906 RepID=UPI0027420630|nr:meiosis inhibitor protein 1-like isoform X2 [Acipenser ruthenus]
MSGLDVVCERIHFRHDPKWTARLGSPDSGQLLCTACVVEMMEDSAISVVRKKHALCCFKSVMTRFPAEVAELLLQDSRVCVHFIGTLLAMLHSSEEASVLEEVIQVLVQLLVELKSDQLLHCVLEECEKKVRYY